MNDLNELKKYIWTDTHAHLAENELFGRVPEILSSVHGVIVPATQVSDWQRVLYLKSLKSFKPLKQESQQSGVRAVALGLHPWFLDLNDLNSAEENLVQLRNILEENPDVWVGEIGLDFHDSSFPFKLNETQKNIQIHVFKKQIQMAQDLQRPVIIHNLRAGANILKCLKDLKFQLFRQKGIVHGFSGSLEEARQFIQCGLKIGIGSLLLNPNAKKTRQAAIHLPLEHLLIETDSPFSGGGTRYQTPENVLRIAQEMAQLRQINLDELSQQLESNLLSLFEK